MKDLSTLQIIFKWFRLRLFIILLFFLCGGTVVTVCLLSDIPMQNIFYALTVCAFFALCFSIVDIYRFASAHRQLYEACRYIEDLSGKLISYGGLIGDDYVAILDELADANKKVLSEMKKRETDANDYYTLWTHQIKTPIAAMRLMLQSESPDPELIRGELFRIERYAEMALNYIRLENIHDDMLLKQHNIYDITASALKKYFILFRIKKLSLDFEQFSLTAITDEKWLEFVIEQIISNCIKYTSTGGISISSHGKKLVIKDTGIGIAPQDIPRIFERGFTGYNGHMNKRSTGLGLYLCKKITDTLGHDIVITSAPGKGTTVEIDFSQESAM